MAQSDQVAPGPGPKLTCSTPRRRAGSRVPQVPVFRRVSFQLFRAEVDMKNPIQPIANDAEAALAADSGHALYDDFDVLAQKGQELPESLCGEARKLPAEETRDSWLINFQDPGSICLG